MNEKDLIMQNDNIGSFLLNNISNLEPDDNILKKITPWEKYMRFVLSGLFLTLFNNSVIAMHYLGLITLLVGFRGLKNANNWFKFGYIITTVYLFIHSLHVLINCSIWNDTILSIPLENTLFIINIAYSVILYLCLWFGIWNLEKKENFPRHSKSPIALLMCYLFSLAIALSYPETTLFALGIIIAFIFIFVCLIKVYKSLSIVGYSISPTIIKVPNILIIIIVPIIMIIGCIMVSLSNNYPMNWTENTEQQPHRHASAKAHLLELGVPEHVLYDLTTDELINFAEASYAIVVEEDYPLYEDNQPIPLNSDSTSSDSTQSNTNAIHLTQVALYMTNDGDTLRIINHFKWITKPTFIGTEAISLSGENIKDITGNITGRLICKNDGIVYSSDYYNISTSELTLNLFGHNLSYPCILAGFSFDKPADEYSGYLTFSIVGEYLPSNTWTSIPYIYIDMKYYHQNRLLLLPPITSLEYAKEDLSSWNTNDTFLKYYIGLDSVPLGPEPIE